MPTRPESVNFRATSADILNAIRNSATQSYQDYVPVANPRDNGSIREIGAVIMNYPALQNEFISTLMNRIGRVILTSKMYDNPWNVFKRGLLDFGETVEEIFVNVAKPFTYDVQASENKVFKRELPDVRTVFHILNYQKFYKTTIQKAQLRQAFLSWDGVTELVGKAIEAMYTASNYDEFIVMKYLLAKHILNGELKAVQVPTISADTIKAVAGEIKGTSNMLTFMSSEYNLAGVENYANKGEQYIIVTAPFDAQMDVEVLAAAFNMDKADFIGHKILIDGFGKLDGNRLGQLFDGDTNYTPLTPEELEALDSVPAVLVARDWFQIFDNLIEMTQNYNGEGMYWNYWLHQWKTFSVSPFHPAVVFVPGAPSVTSVTVSPSSATVMPGQTLLLSATVATNYFASKSVEWSAGEAEGVTVSPLGEVHIDSTVTSETEITVTATSKFDPTKSASATLTVG